MSDNEYLTHNAQIDRFRKRLRFAFKTLLSQKFLAIIYIVCVRETVNERV